MFTWYFMHIGQMILLIFFRIYSEITNITFYTQTCFRMKSVTTYIAINKQKQVLKLFDLRIQSFSQMKPYIFFRMKSKTTNITINMKRMDSEIFWHRIFFLCCHHSSLLTCKNGLGLDDSSDSLANEKSYYKHCM